MKNAIIYKAHLPAANELSAHMEDRPWRELQSFEKKRHAFIADEDGTKVHRFPGGYSFCMRTDEKIIPSDVVNAELQKREDAFAKNYGRRPDTEESKRLRQEIMDEFLERALVKEKLTWAYYDEDHQFLYVDSASPGIADALMGELVQCCASVKTETINVSGIKMGLTTRLRNTIEHENDLGAFSVGNSLRLTRKFPEEPVERVVYTDSEILSREVLEQIRHGFQVEHIALGMEGMWFNLTHKFHFRRIEWPPLEEAFDGTVLGEISDESEIERLTTATRVTLARGAVLELCRLMDYQPPSLEDDEE